MSKPDYDTTLARIAGNIAAGIMPPVSGEVGEVLSPTMYANAAEAAVKVAMATAVAIRKKCRELHVEETGA